MNIINMSLNVSDEAIVSVPIFKRSNAKSLQFICELMGFGTWIISNQ